MDLQLPEVGIPDRVSMTGPLLANQKAVYAELDGPGCIQHLWVVLSRPERIPMTSRKALIRIYFDDEPIPYVEAPVGDFFGGHAWPGLVSDRHPLPGGQGLDWLQLLLPDALRPIRTG